MANTILFKITSTLKFIMTLHILHRHTYFTYIYLLTLHFYQAKMISMSTHSYIQMFLYK